MQSSSDSDQKCNEKKGTQACLHARQLALSPGHDAKAKLNHLRHYMSSSNHAPAGPASCTLLVHPGLPVATISTYANLPLKHPRGQLYSVEHLG